MKKELKLFGILLVSGLILGACSNQKKGEKTSNENEKTSSVSSVRSKKSQEKSQSSSSVKKDASASSAGSASDASSSSGSNLEARETSTSSPTLDLNNKRLSEINASIRNNLGSILLPSSNGLDSAPGYLNMRYTGDANNFSVDYIVSYSPYGLNDGATSGHVPYATFVKKTYDSESAAANDVPYQPSDSSSGLPTVDLGHGISGVMDSGAGQRYLQWNEGRWSFVVHASAVVGEDPVPTAQHVVDLLERYYLPAPSTKGGGQLEATASENVLTWNKGNVLYTLKGKNIDTLVKMAASVK